MPRCGEAHPAIVIASEDAEVQGASPRSMYRESAEQKHTNRYAADDPAENGQGQLFVEHWNPWDWQEIVSVERGGEH